MEDSRAAGGLAYKPRRTMRGVKGHLRVLHTLFYNCLRSVYCTTLDKNATARGRHPCGNCCGLFPLQRQTKLLQTKFRIPKTPKSLIGRKALSENLLFNFVESFL